MNLLTCTSAAPGVVVSTQLTSSGDQAVYTVPTSPATALLIKKASIENTTSSPITIGVSIVKAGGTLGDGTHRVVSQTFSLSGNNWYDLTEIAGHFLGPGDVVAANPSATGIDFVMSGVLFS